MNQEQQEPSLEAMFAGGRRAEQYRDVEAPPDPPVAATGVTVTDTAATSAPPPVDVETHPQGEDHGYAAPEPDVQRPSAPEPAAPDVEKVHPVTAEAAPVVHPALQGRVIGAELVESAPAAAAASASVKESPLKRLLRKLGLGQTPPDPDELASEDFERIIRQAVWTRSVNIAVITSAGGDGSTPAALMLSNTLAWIRGGGVATVEGTIAPGALTRLAEGTPRRGIAEMLAASDRIASAGALAGYSAPQTAHSDIFGSVGPRDQLTDKDVRVARELLDTYYKITVTDADHNLQAEATQTVIDTADAVLIPCVRHPQSLIEAWRTFETIATARPDLADNTGQTVPRAMFVVGSDGPGEDPVWVESAAAWLRTKLSDHCPSGTPAALVQEVPFEPVMKAGNEITHAHCTRSSLAAWKRVSAGVVLGLMDAPEQARPLLAAPTHH